MIKKKKNFCEKTKIQKFKISNFFSFIFYLNTSKMKLKYNLICILITKINKMLVKNKYMVQ